METIDFSRLKRIETEWEEIEASYRLAPYEAPTNLPAEKQKTFEAFARGKTYDPQFDYLTPPEFPARRIRKLMADLEPEQSIFESEYYEKARNELLSIECVQWHDPRAISGLSCLVYGQPDLHLVEEAQRIMSAPITKGDADEIDMISAEEAAATIQSVLHNAGLVWWRAVVHEPMLAKMAVHRLDKEIRIRAGAAFTPKGIRRLIVHEIGVHVLRYENGSRQPIKLFSSGFNNYLETEEGLAVYEEQKAGLLEPATLKKYAGRVMAAHQAANQPFNEVFATLANQFDLETAFDIAARAKRSFKDTSKPGAYAKDKVYLSGLLAVSTHLENCAEDRDLLFTGKIGLENLPMAQILFKSAMIVAPNLLPSDLLDR